jgi:microcystin-dependent protein
MSEPFLAQISIFSFAFPPKGWAFANGQTLPINQNQALFSLMGTTYGGNGTTTFQLPNLQASVPIHQGSGFVIGQAGGTRAVTLTTSQLPAHTHAASCSKDAGTLASPGGSSVLWAADGNGNLPYSTGGGAAMAPAAISSIGGGEPHENEAPYLVLNFCIALQGIFPSRS